MVVQPSSESPLLFRRSTCVSNSCRDTGDGLRVRRPVFVAVRLRPAQRLSKRRRSIPMRPSKRPLTRRRLLLRRRIGSRLVLRGAIRISRGTTSTTAAIRPSSVPGNLQGRLSIRKRKLWPRSRRPSRKTRTSTRERFTTTGRNMGWTPGRAASDRTCARR
jgi:hypothetical protein